MKLVREVKAFTDRSPRPVSGRSLTRLLRALLITRFPFAGFDLVVNLVDSTVITCLNEEYLKHAGSTDVITFDYNAEDSQCKKKPVFLSGEIFICVDEAIIQAHRFRAPWEQEVVRYAIHGILHLAGYDDRSAAQKRIMKREEDRLVRAHAESLGKDAIHRSRRKTRHA